MPLLHQMYAPGEKNYTSRDFRAAFPPGTAYSGDVMRHKFDCEMAKAAAEYMPGPRLSEETLAEYRKAISQSDNVHYYGSKAANDADRNAVNKILEARHFGYEDRFRLTAHEAAHIRSGAEWLAAHYFQFSDGFLRSALRIYENAIGPDGRPVVNPAWFGI